MSTTASRPTDVGTDVSPTTAGIDPRGARFAAAVTSVVLAAILVISSGSPWSTTATVVLAAAQTAVFAVGATRGVQHTPYAWLFRRLVRPRLGPPTDLEDPAPPRFAQTVGLAFLVVALVAFVAGATLVGQIAVGLALVAALLNAAVGFCLGCEIYLLLKRLAPAAA